VHVAVIVRLQPAPLAEGRVVGHAEIVDTGQRRPVRSAEELIEVLCALTPGTGSPPGSRDDDMAADRPSSVCPAERSVRSSSGADSIISNEGAVTP
jgi:hypothetical protein